MIAKKNFYFLLFIATLNLHCSSSSFGGASKKIENPKPAKETNAAGSKKPDINSKNADAADTTTSPAPLVGLWDARGYTCVDSNGNLYDIPTEIIKITEENGRFIGTKMTGDPCVPANSLTFQGTRDGSKLTIRFYTGTPGAEPVLETATYVGTYSSSLIEINVKRPSMKPITLTPHKTSLEPF
jgi:hypothetical protein